MPMYRFDRPWPRGITRRDIRVIVGDEPNPRRTVEVSPPEMEVSLGSDDEFKEGDQITLEILSYSRSDRPNKDVFRETFTVSGRPDIPDNPDGTLTIFDQELLGEPQPPTQEPIGGQNTTGGAITGGNEVVAPGGPVPAAEPLESESQRMDRLARATRETKVQGSNK